MTKLSGKLPKGDGNGLGPLIGKLVHEPHKIHVVVALVDCSKTSTDNDTGEIEPTVRVRRIEAIAGQDKQLAEGLLRRALEKRLGMTVLDYDLEQDLRVAFAENDDTDQDNR